MKKEIEDIVKYLTKRAGEDMASMQVNNEGKIFLRVGISCTESLSIDEFAAMVQESTWGE